MNPPTNAAVHPRPLRLSWQPHRPFHRFISFPDEIYIMLVFSTHMTHEKKLSAKAKETFADSPIREPFFLQCAHGSKTILISRP
ncbi:hypothetical protein [Geobacillus sp. 47C-IIb]|uniref:hypothetical protein n=1 Tax=Geobacillus sp. 47C-IIb TaxID=1963026 RepID=UPI00168170F2|nr:hypothetical protein [Geobacillus sp. 47C-IIb]QNU30635.1 hypothetical protein IC804_14555 [Geobacillus sp. 47C-IIb]